MEPPFFVDHGTARPVTPCIIMTNKNHPAPSQTAFGKPSRARAHAQDPDLARLIALMERMGAASQRPL